MGMIEKDEKAKYSDSEDEGIGDKNIEMLSRNRLFFYILDGVDVRDEYKIQTQQPHF